MIRVSEIVLPARVETCTDAYQCLNNERQREHYIATYGDVDCEYNTQFDVYRVPAFAEKIKSYTQAKAADCAIWGCE